MNRHRIKKCRSHTIQYLYIFTTDVQYSDMKIAQLEMALQKKFAILVLVLSAICSQSFQFKSVYSQTLHLKVTDPVTLCILLQPSYICIVLHYPQHMLDIDNMLQGSMNDFERYKSPLLLHTASYCKH